MEPMGDGGGDGELYASVSARRQKQIETPQPTIARLILPALS
jgi:hypothetical protein